MLNGLVFTSAVNARGYGVVKHALITLTVSVCCTQVRRRIRGNDIITTTTRHGQR